MRRNMKSTSTGITLTLLAVALSACTGPGAATKTTVAAPAPSYISGKVVETMDAGGYTYICLEKDGKKSWVAAPVMKVSVGQELKLLPGAEMNQFASKALNRTFDKIIFSGGLEQAPAATAAGKEDAAKESTEPILIGKVVETMDAASYTYINLEKDGKTAWSAVPAASVKVGDEVELLPGTAMGKFTSKTLNRTFNSIYFAGGVKGEPEAATAAAAKLPAGHPNLDQAAQPAAASTETAPLPAGHPKVAAAAPASAPAPAAAGAISGKVVETANAGGYTYICLENDGKKSWVAVPTMKVSVGQEVALAPGATMSNFVSKSLNRTFEKIVFSSGMAR